MKLVVDANIFFILIKKGKTEELLYDDMFELYAPEFLFDEFQKYEGLILLKTQRTPNDFNRILTFLKKNIVFFYSTEELLRIFFLNAG